MEKSVVYVRQFQLHISVFPNVFNKMLVSSKMITCVLRKIIYKCQKLFFLYYLTLRLEFKIFEMGTVAFFELLSSVFI